MRLIYCFILMCTVLPSFAQDDLPLPDYRNKKENYSRMAEKDLKANVASFAFAALEDRLGKAPLRALPATDYGANFITFEGDGIRVTIKSGLFEQSKHKLQYYNEKHLVKIDGKPYYGSYGIIPQYTVGSVTVIMDKDTVAFPAAATMDLYSPVFTYADDKGVARTHNGVYFSPDNRTMYIYMINKETIGSYEVTWIIQDKKYLRRVVDSGILK